MSFQQKLISARKKTGLSQEEMAAKIGISRSNYGHLEQGTRRPQLDRLTQLLDALDLSDEDRAELSHLAYLERSDEEMQDLVTLLTRQLSEVRQENVELGVKVVSMEAKLSLLLAHLRRLNVQLPEGFDKL